MMNKYLLIIKLVLIILFIGCLFDWEYGYFQLVRFSGMVGFGILAHNDYEKNKDWFLIWLSSAILINPIFKITLSREIWNTIDIIWAVLLAISIFKNQQNKLKKNKLFIKIKENVRHLGNELIYPTLIMFAGAIILNIILKYLFELINKA